MIWLCLFSIAVVTCLPNARGAQPVIAGVPGTAHRTAVVNFSELAQQEAGLTAPAVSRPREAPVPLRPELALPAAEISTNASTEFAAPLVLAPSPPTTASFLAILDNYTAIPPDTMGAVGPNHLMTTLNSQVRIQTRSGVNVSTVSLNSFWASLGNPDVFDPHVAYDPLGGRWIFSAAANSQLASAAVLVGVSASSDPTGNWFLYKVTVDPAGQQWADFDQLGFNKDWVVVSANIFKKSNGFQAVSFWVFNKADLYANGTGKFTLLQSTTDKAFSVSPAQTFDGSLAILYLVENWNGSQGQLRISQITGPVGSEKMTFGSAFPTTTNRWAEFGGDNFAPQLGSSTGIDTGDSRTLCCSYRNGSLWASQNAFLPLNSPTRCAAQWWQLLPDGTVQQFGRIDDPTGNQFFAYPSLAANASNDVLIGYSRFSATQYASANYAFRFAHDPPSTMRADTILHPGEAVYVKTGGNTGLNRWGDFSATCVDPVNDMTLWTIQEYGSTNRWATWWGRVDPDLSGLKLVLTQPADGISFPSNPTITLTATRFDTNTTFAKVEFYADNEKVGESLTEPYTTTWSGAVDGVHVMTAVGTETMGGMATSAAVIVTVGDAASPIGTWETKLSGAGKGTALLTFNDDYSVSGYGMILRQFGLFEISGTWSFTGKHQTMATYTETLDGTVIYTGSLSAKVSAGKKVSGKVIPPTTSTKALTLKGIPQAPVPDLTGSWSASVKIGSTSGTETYQLSASPSWPNVFDLSGSVTGVVLETAKGQINISTEDFPERSLSGKAKLTSFTAKGADAQGVSVKINATKP
jgi:hypothetical protein